MKILGIDYGSKKVGIAISDDGGTLAFPKNTLSNNENLIDELRTICRDEKIQALVFGESLNAIGEENPIMRDVQLFKEILDRELKLPIFMQKEAFTSMHTRTIDKTEKTRARKTRKKVVKDDDESAAALILQRYLDKKNMDPDKNLTRD